MNEKVIDHIVRTKQISDLIQKRIDNVVLDFIGVERETKFLSIKLKISNDFPNLITGLPYCLFRLQQEGYLEVKEKITKLGRWWAGKEEIDLIGLSDNTKQIIFIECKWKENVNAKEMLYQLKLKVGLVNWNLKKREEYYCIIAKSFSAKSMKDHSIIQSKNILLFTLNDFKSLFI